MKTYKHRKSFSVFGRICAITAVIMTAGCHTPHAPVLTGEDSTVKQIRISAITEFVPDSAVSNGMQIKTLVEISDAFDSPVKVPCVLRFEFYEFHPLSSDPRGKRLKIWPEQKLNDPNMNDEHWKDLLRGYEFFLPLEFALREGQKYVLEVTCQVDQQRHNDFFKMRYQP
jgi:hypothetical protein